MKRVWVFSAVLPLVPLLFASCATMSNLVGKPTYDPSSYGTAALIETVRSPQSVTSDATAAAKQLAQRTLSEEEGRELMDVLQENKNWKVRVALLQTMAAKHMTYLREDLAAYALEAPDSETAVAAATTVVELTSDQVEVLRFSTKLLIASAYPAARARSARLIADAFPEYAERVFVKALDEETSASSATLMCEFLAQKGSSECLPVLDEIANNVTRVYQIDNYLGVKTTSESVRAAAVRGSERLKGL